MLELLIGGAAIAIGLVWVAFTLFVKAVLVVIAAYIVATVLSYVATLVIRSGRVISRLWRLWASKKGPTVVDIPGEECRPEECPDEVWSALKNGQEVVVKKSA